MRRREIIIYALTLLASLIGHTALFGGLSHAARRGPPSRQRAIEVAVLSKEPVKPPEPPKPKPPAPKPKVVDLTQNLPPPTPSEQPKPEKPRPVFGVSMRSTVGPGSGFAVRVGNTLMKAPEAEFTPPDQVNAYRPVPMHQISKLPHQVGDCRVPYPAGAKEQRIEGVVELELDVDTDGSVKGVRVIKGLGFGLDEAASAAMRACRFAPGEVAGQAVPTRIPWRYRFVIED